MNMQGVQWGAAQESLVWFLGALIPLLHTVLLRARDDPAACHQGLSSMWLWRCPDSPHPPLAAPHLLVAGECQESKAVFLTQRWFYSIG